MFRMLIAALRAPETGGHARPDRMATRARNLVVWLWTGSTESEHGNGRHDIENLSADAPTALQLVRRQARERAAAAAWAAVMNAVDAEFPTARARFDRRVAQADRAAEPVRRATRQVVTQLANVAGPVRHRITEQMTEAQQSARRRFDLTLELRKHSDATIYGRLAPGEPGFLERARRARNA